MYKIKRVFFQRNSIEWTMEEIISDMNTNRMISKRLMDVLIYEKDNHIRYIPCEFFSTKLKVGELHVF